MTGRVGAEADEVEPLSLTPNLNKLLDISELHVFGMQPDPTQVTLLNLSPTSFVASRSGCTSRGSEQWTQYRSRHVENIDCAVSTHERKLGARHAAEALTPGQGNP